MLSFVRLVLAIAVSITAFASFGYGVGQTHRWGPEVCALAGAVIGGVLAVMAFGPGGGTLVKTEPMP